jgi:hypothetical protein
VALAVSPTTKNFGSVVHASGNASQTFTLTPDLSSDSIFGVTITGADAADFTTTETYDKPPAGAQVSQYGNSTVLTAESTFDVTFAPATAGSKAATLEVHYNGVGGAYTLQVPLTGTAT